MTGESGAAKPKTTPIAAGRAEDAKADEKETDSAKADPQTPEGLRAAGIRPSSTAAGLAASGDANKGERSEVEPEDTREDNLLHSGGAIGAQLEPALFTKGGSIPHNMLPSPSGLVPASLITDDKERETALEAAKAGILDSKKAKKNSRGFLSREKLESMSPAEVRAVAHDRGYDVGEGGRRGILNKFLVEQDEDTTVEEEAEEGSQTIPVVASAGGGVGTGPLPAVGAASAATAAAHTRTAASLAAEGRPSPSEGSKKAAEASMKAQGGKK